MRCRSPCLPGESEEMILLKSKNMELEQRIDRLNEMYLEALGKVQDELTLLGSQTVSHS